MIDNDELSQNTEENRIKDLLKQMLEEGNVFSYGHFFNDKDTHCDEKMLQAPLVKALQPLVTDIPESFYLELCRLCDLTSMDSFPFLGHLTNQIIYKRLPPLLFKDINENLSNSKESRIILSERLSSIITMMSNYDTYDEFLVKLDKVYPKWTSIQ